VGVAMAGVAAAQQLRPVGRWPLSHQNPARVASALAEPVLLSEFLRPTLIEHRRRGCMAYVQGLPALNPWSLSSHNGDGEALKGYRRAASGPVAPRRPPYRIPEASQVAP